MISSIKNQPLTIVLALLLFATLLVYAQIISFGFIEFDLELYLSSNPMVQSGLNWTSVQWAFTNSHFNWHPLTWLSHMLDVQLYGLDPAGHNLTSLLLHLINAIVVLYLCVALTGSVWVSFLVAYFFAIHPMHVQPVVWLAARKDLLTCLFGFLSILFYLKYHRQDKASWLFMSLCCFVCSLMSKATFITLPIILLLLDFWPLGRLAASKSLLVKIILQKVPYVLLAGVTLLVAYFAQAQAQALRSMSSITFYDRLANAVLSYWEYLKKLFYPVNLSIFYPYREEFSGSTFFIGVSILLAFSLIAIRYIRKYPYIFVGWFWFVISMIPMIGFVQLGDQAMADRYTYYTHFGLLLLIFCGAKDFISYLRINYRLLALTTTCLLLLFGALTQREVARWHSSESIYRHSLQITRDNYYLHAALATTLSNQQRLSEAIEEYQITLKLNPANPRFFKNIGDIYLTQKKYPEALAAYQELYAVEPENVSIINNIGVVQMFQGNFSEAEKYFSQALAVNPNYVLARKNLDFVRTKVSPSP